MVRGSHILGGLRGTANISVAPANGLIDARSGNVWYLGVDFTINGIQGAGIMGQVVTFISPTGRRNTITNNSSNVNIHASAKIYNFGNRDFSLRGPMSVRYIYDAVATKWYRLI